MSLRMRSSAWLFFDKTADPAVARCSLCGTSIKSYSSTTNLLKHLRSRHFEETSAEINWDNSAGDNADQLVDDSSVADVSELTEIPSVDGESDEIQLPVEDVNALLSSVSSIRSNRSPAWYCFTPFKGKNLAKCKFCHTSFRYNKTGSTSSLVHHFALKHNDIYLKVVAELSKNSVSAMEGVTDDDEEAEFAEFKGCLEPADSGEVSSDVALALLQEDNDDLAAVVAEVTMNQFGVNHTDRRKATRSLAWMCFARIANSDVAVCKYCRMVVKTESGTTSNMLNHFQKRHHKEYESAKAQRESGGTEEPVEQQIEELTSEDVIDQDFTSQDESMSAELLADELTVRSNKSIVWSCFSKNNLNCQKGPHQCIHCGVCLRADYGSTSSMLAHFMKKHPAEYRLASCGQSVKTKSPTKSAMIRQHYSQVTSEDWCCSFCQRVLRQPGNSVSNLVKHLMKKHKSEYNLIINESNFPSKSVKVKTELVDDEDDDDDDDGNGEVGDEADDSLFNGSAIESETIEQPTKRKKFLTPSAKITGESSLSKMANLWRRHCQERQKENDRQVNAMKNKLSSLQDSMKKIADEISSVQSEISKTEDAWRKELTRQKEVNRQFQSALKQAETAESSELASAADTASESTTSYSGSLAMHVDDSDWAMGQ